MYILFIAFFISILGRLSQVPLGTPAPKETFSKKFQQIFGKEVQHNSNSTHSKTVKEKWLPIFCLLISQTTSK